MAAPPIGSHAGRSDNGFLDARQHPVSTFPVDVDTASYAHVKRFIEGRRLPPAEAVRIEELLNYFSYRYPGPVATAGADPGAPVAASLEVAGAPWAPAHRLVRIGLKGREVAAAERPAAHPVFLPDVSGSMDAPTRLPLTIAKDVKVQVEFNPARVASYRLVGYENRARANEEFTDDDVGAAEIGAGHTVTALYEIVPVGAKGETAAGTRAGGEIDEFRSAPKSAAPEAPADGADELLTVKLHYKDPKGGASRRIEFPLVDRGGEFAKASADFRFAAAVAEFGMILRSSPNRGNATLSDVLAWPADAADSPADDPDGQRGEFLDLVRKTQLLME
ncbi:MAG: von Willebrand factor type A domain-containing protein [Verrucomicrobia bacterium]|nr:von Willebrand factor type A domain-containing protein [Verrucomicrobiota bacterium]